MLTSCRFLQMVDVLQEQIVDASPLLDGVDGLTDAEVGVVPGREPGTAGGGSGDHAGDLLEELVRIPKLRGDAVAGEPAREAGEVNRPGGRHACALDELVERQEAHLLIVVLVVQSVVGLPRAVDQERRMGHVEDARGGWRRTRRSSGRFDGDDRRLDGTCVRGVWTLPHPRRLPDSDQRSRGARCDSTEYVCYLFGLDSRRCSETWQAGGVLARSSDGDRQPFHRPGHLERIGTSSSKSAHAMQSGLRFSIRSNAPRKISAPHSEHSDSRKTENTLMPVTIPPSCRGERK